MISILILDTFQHMSIQLPHQVILKLNQNKYNDPSVSKQTQLQKKEHNSRVVHTKVLKCYPSSLRAKKWVTCLAVLSFNPLIYATISTIYLINRHSGVIYNFYFFGHDWSRYLTRLSAKWLGMTCNCIWGTEIAFEINMFMHKNVFTLPVSFTGSYTTDKRNLPRQNNLILQKKVVWCAQGCEF